VSGIPYFDPTNKELLEVVTLAKAERFLAEGVAVADRTKSGRIRRLWRRRNRERAYGSSADVFRALHGAASITTTRQLNGAGVASILIFKKQSAPTPRIVVEAPPEELSHAASAGYPLPTGTTTEWQFPALARTCAQCGARNPPWRAKKTFCSDNCFQAAAKAQRDAQKREDLVHV
jgi:hypothetical protein